MLQIFKKLLTLTEEQIVYRLPKLVFLEEILKLEKKIVFMMGKYLHITMFSREKEADFIY